VARLTAASRLHERLADGRHKLLVVLQGMDTSGKGGAVRKAFEGLNPAGVHVASFKAPTEAELSHDFLWRVHPHAPGRGQIAIFDRSHYEDVLIVRVRGLVPETRWRARYRHIRNFEAMLADEARSSASSSCTSRAASRPAPRSPGTDARPPTPEGFHAGDLAERKLGTTTRRAYRTSSATPPPGPPTLGGSWCRPTASGGCDHGRRLPHDVVETSERPRPAPPAGG
jgi:hypothetical protein